MVQGNRKGKKREEFDEEMQDVNEPHPTPPPPVSRSTRHMPRIDDRRDELELVWYGHPQFPYPDHPPYAFGSPQPRVRGAPVPYTEPIPRGKPVDRM